MPNALCGGCTHSKPAESTKCMEAIHNGYERFSRDVARPLFRLGLFAISHYINSRPWPDPMSCGAMFFQEFIIFAPETFMTNQNMWKLQHTCCGVVSHQNTQENIVWRQYCLKTSRKCRMHGVRAVRPQSILKMPRTWWGGSMHN